MTLTTVLPHRTGPSSRTDPSVRPERPGRSGRPERPVRSAAPERPLVGYLLLVPEGTDPATLFAPGFTPDLVPEPVPEAVRSAAADARTGPVRIDAEQRVAQVDGRELSLTYLEFELLALLVGTPHRVHSRASLVSGVWGYGHVGDGRTVDVHVARLRRKLGAAHRHRIVTVRRVGYKYVPYDE